MNYEEMWLILKKVVIEEGKVFRYYDQDYYKGQEEEAEYILDQMEIIEEKYKEVANEDH